MLVLLRVLVLGVLVLLEMDWERRRGLGFAVQVGWVLDWRGLRRFVPIDSPEAF
jgi:hypothetical protein